jgi:hypothetical protein
MGITLLYFNELFITLNVWIDSVVNGWKLRQKTVNLISESLAYQIHSM